jgi:hypothetical protein
MLQEDLLKFVEGVCVLMKHEQRQTKSGVANLVLGVKVRASAASHQTQEMSSRASSVSRRTISIAAHSASTKEGPR